MKEWIRFDDRPLQSAQMIIEAYNKGHEVRSLLVLFPTAVDAFFGIEAPGRLDVEMCGVQRRPAEVDR